MSIDLYSTEKYHKRKLKKFGFEELAEFINSLLEQNPHSCRKELVKRTMFKEQVIINFPILYISSIWIYLYFLEHNLDTILFASRDCCQLYKVFKALFPKVKCYYFNCSRNMFETATVERNKYFREYVKSLINKVEKTLYVDQHGTNKRVINYFSKEFGKLPHSIQISSRFKDETECTTIMSKIIDMSKCTSLVFGTRGSPIEMLNYDLIGTLQTYDSKGPVRNKLEYDYNLIKTYHGSIGFILKYLRPLKYEEIKKYSMPDLRRLLVKLFRCILINKPIISTTIKHIGRHAKIISLDNEEKKKDRECETCLQ